MEKARQNITLNVSTNATVVSNSEELVPGHVRQMAHGQTHQWKTHASVSKGEIVCIDR